MAAPGLLDHLLARGAWDGLITDEPASPRPDNLFEPVDDKASLGGRFAPVARPRAITASATLVRGLAGLAVLGTVAGLMRRPSKPKSITTAQRAPLPKTRQ